MTTAARAARAAHGTPSKQPKVMTLRQLGTDAACHAQPILFDRAAAIDTPAYLGGRHADRQHTEYVDAARSLCHACPAFDDCLNRALTGKPVDGFVAGTNEEHRHQLRSILNIAEQREGDLSRAAGLAEQARGKVDDDVLYDAIRTNPDATNAALGRIVGCDPHTIARARRRLAAQATNPEPAPPSPAAVRATYLRVVRS